MTKRQSLKLVGEILLDRTNFNVMTRYISSEENLKTMMNLLRDKSKNIQFEAFHVFKVRSARCYGHLLFSYSHSRLAHAGLRREPEETGAYREHPP